MQVSSSIFESLFLKHSWLTHEIGTGSVLAAMRSGIPLVIVPNPDLANNHQEELAGTLEHLGYAHKSAPE